MNINNHAQVVVGSFLSININENEKIIFNIKIKTPSHNSTFIFSLPISTKNYINLNKIYFKIILPYIIFCFIILDNYYKLKNTYTLYFLLYNLFFNSLI